LTDAIEEIKKHTRHYAKRQMTWFKKDMDFEWFHPADINKMIRFAEIKIS
jgi:tRNA dimethylallyltransferase